MQTWTIKKCEKDGLEVIEIVGRVEKNDENEISRKKKKHRSFVVNQKSKKHNQKEGNSLRDLLRHTMDFYH